ncbi:acyl--CoA ligase [Porticoccaceae bacterium]|nr:acyl--CoA ligase [Porticoccaceae bacterium]
MPASSATYHSAVSQLTSAGAPFEIVDSVRNGTAMKAFKNAAQSLLAVVNEGRQFGDAPFVTYEGKTHSFADFFAQVDRLRSTLITQQQIKKGDKIAIAMRNRPEWMVSFVAILGCGAVAVPLNSWGREEELSQGLDDSEAKLVICDWPRYQFIEHKLPSVRALVVEPKGACGAGASLWQLDQVANESAPEVVSNPEDAAIMLFTSGTSGRPKGVLFDHFSACQALFNIEFIGAATYMTNLDAMNQQLAAGVPAKTLLSVPLFHISGLYSQFLVNLKYGRAIHLMYKWDVDEAYRLIEDEGITVLMGAPTMLLDLLQHPDIDKLDLSRISNISAGGAATPSALADLYKSKLPKSMPGAGWGLTETGGTGAAFTGVLMSQFPGTAGFLSPIIESSFRDEAGQPVADGEPGEIWIKSPTCIQSYVSGDCSGDDFFEGWFKSGDVGYLNAEGILVICDRVKDMIIRGGENIYPAEIENCLLSLDGCQEAAVFGIPNDRLGEEVAATVVCSAEAPLTVADIQAYCSKHLAAFKVPQHIHISAQTLPRNATKKPLKRQIKQQFIDHQAANADC